MRGTIICQDCRAEVVSNAPTQRYCPACSEKRDRMRKRLWVRENPPSPQQTDRNRQHAEYRRELSREAGVEVNQDAARSIAWMGDGPQLLWCARVAVPFSYAASKNHIYARTQRGHVAMRREAAAKRQEIALLVRHAVQGVRVAHNKIWIDILVQKPDHRGDAVNVVDLVCDAVKDALNIDDRWFSIRRLDWEIAKSDPQLYVGVGQDSDRDCNICSYCGQIKELSEFNANRTLPLGVGRECKDCRHQGRVLGKRQDLSAVKDICHEIAPQP